MAGKMRGRGPGSPAATSRRFVVTGFVFIAVGVLLSTAFALVQTVRLEDNARDIVDDMLTSIRLVGRIEALEEKRRILVDDHILSTKLAEMDSLEAQIASIDREIARAAAAYDRWAILPGEPDERTVWARARAEAARLDPPIARVIALSRANRDVEAQQVLVGVAADFEQLSGDLDRLIAINDHEAAASRKRFGMIRYWLALTLALIGVAGLMGTLAVGVWAARQVAHREAALALNARLLEARNRELDAFASRVAHDIRGPLATLALALDVLSGRLPRDDRHVAMLRRVTKQMGALVDDLLTLARTPSQVPGRCDPVELAATLQEDFGPRAEAEHGALRISLEHAQVACSEGLLCRALTNLLDNAFKYRKRDVGPEVVVWGAVSEGGYDLRVSDNGVGMSKEEAIHLFEPFYRAPSTKGLPGTGLGLSIVNRVAEASGGTMSFETAPGRGTTFVMHLPLAS